MNSWYTTCVCLAAGVLTSVPPSFTCPHPGGTSSIGCYASCPTTELLSRAAAPGSTAPLLQHATSGLRALPAAASDSALAPHHDLRPFYLAESLSDALLVAGDAQLPAHRLVLSASPRFREVRQHTCSCF